MKTMRMLRSLTLLGLLLTKTWAQYPLDWIVDTHSYEHTMTVTALLNIAGDQPTNASDVVAAFNGSECRGVAEPIMVDGQYMYFLVVYGNTGGDPITFKVWDSEVGNAVDLANTVAFESGQSHGTVDSALVFAVFNSPPGNFSLIMPENATYVGGGASTPVDFIWVSPTDPENDPMTMEIIVREGTVWDTLITATTNMLPVDVEGFPREVWLDWYVQATDIWGLTTLSNAYSLKIASAVSIAPEAGIPTAFQIYQNFPNPFNPSTIITYEMDQGAKLVFQIFDLQGRLVSQLPLGLQSSGEHELIVDLTNPRYAELRSGVYFYRLQAYSTAENRLLQSDTHRMSILK